jgi:hypothetical protein
MEEVAKLLGVEFDKDFECNESPCTYRITKYGALCDGVRGAESLMMLLDGTLTVKQKPWSPKNNDMFFVVLCDGDVAVKYWDNDSTTHRTYYKIGNCYRHFNEAKDYREKWISFYASDEILEV